MSVTGKDFNFCYQSAQQFVEFFSKFFGPVRKAFTVVGSQGRQALENDILQTIADFNIGADGAICVPSRYVELVVKKK